MDLGLNGAVVIVTGGGEGIGRATAWALAHEGARVVICGRREHVLRAAAEAIAQETGGEVLPLVCDVDDESQVRAMVDAVVQRWGRVDGLVNNAGTSNAAPFESVTDEAWSGDLQTKLYGAVYCSRAVIPHMRTAGGGRIVNITTGAGKAPTAGSLPTSLARAAGIALTKAMSRDLAPHNILVNTVCIGLIKSGQHERSFERTPRGAETLEDFYAGMGRGVPLGRVGEGREAGEVICFLLSQRASYITGTALNIDGGSSPVV
jgi:3-oxoacyl-[acyl-carrier protein] reductase